MGISDDPKQRGPVAGLYSLPENSAVFAVTTQLCGAIMMVALASFCVIVASRLSQSHVRWIVRSYARMGIPAEHRPEAWFVAGMVHASWAVVCICMAVAAARAVKCRKAGVMAVVATCHGISTIVVLGWGVAMANFVRVPLLLVALLWFWTLWGYVSLARSWRAEPIP